MVKVSDDRPGIQLMPGTTFRNGMPESKPYVYQGTGRDSLEPEKLAERAREQARAHLVSIGVCPDCLSGDCRCGAPGEPG